MSEINKKYAFSPWQNMIYLGVCVLLGFFVGQSLIAVVLRISLSTATDEQMLWAQALSSCCVFVLPGWWFLVRRRANLHALFRCPRVLVFLLVACLAGCAVILNAVVIAWNESLPPPVPPWLREWMDAQQTSYNAIVQRLLVSHTLLDYLVRLFVMAILPAVGEELMFRHILQREFIRVTGNVHVGIVLAALLFSLFHLQWIGIFPRLLLGMLFGYLYHLSSSLATAVWAHFLNNGFIVTMGYLYGLGVIDPPRDASGSLDMGAGEPPSVFVVMLTLAAFLGLFWACWRHCRALSDGRT